MKKLVIELDVNMSDFTEEEANQFIEFAKGCTSINIEAGAAHWNDHLSNIGVAQVLSLSSEYFKVGAEE